VEVYRAGVHELSRLADASGEVFFLADRRYREIFFGPMLLGLSINIIFNICITCVVHTIYFNLYVYIAYICIYIYVNYMYIYTYIHMYM
jgi:hypothetical protein